MKFGRLILAGAAALVIAGPAFAQWPPPPPPFVTNPRLAPPMTRPMPAPAARPMTPAEARAARRAERQHMRKARKMKENACKREAQERKLSGKMRRQFVARCLAH